MIKICKKHGEISEERIRQKKRCLLCIREKSTKWRIANREKHRASAGRARKLNRERANKWTKQDRKKNPEKYKKWAAENRLRQGAERNTQHIIKKVGITRENYNKMLLEHNNKCGICNKEETRRSRTAGKITRLCIDHCHKTNKIRGLICAKCNLMLSYANDCPDIMKNAEIYLRSTRSWETIL